MELRIDFPRLTKKQITKKISDAAGQRNTELKGEKTNGNAVGIIAKLMGVDENVAQDYLADPKYHVQLIKTIKNDINGRAWLKRDSASRSKGASFIGDEDNILEVYVPRHSVNGFFRAALRVKKA